MVLQYKHSTFDIEFCKERPGSFSIVSLLVDESSLPAQSPTVVNENGASQTRRISRSVQWPFHQTCFYEGPYPENIRSLKDNSHLNVCWGKSLASSLRISHLPAHRRQRQMFYLSNPTDKVELAVPGTPECVVAVALAELCVRE
jgi:hypothetical protein